MNRGTLRVYLGAAPGVGKTFAMLSEGRRRAERGADVVIGVVETHGRTNTATQIGSLEQIAPRVTEHRGVELHDLDVAAILERRPDVVLVDEFAHTNAPGGRNGHRWEDVAELLDAGIDVITTLNIQHLESLNDVVAQITGVQQRETVPDALVRSADQIELVDMSPEALRRRLAHGNVYPAERVDAALANFFRPGNLAALRELALLWVADRVEDSLGSYLAAHGISTPWETRERVVVGITAAPGGDRLIRRAARLAGRVGGELLGVHVVTDEGLAPTDTGDADVLEAQRTLVRELGGTVHEWVGDSPAEALGAFATSERATQLVVGESHRSRRYELVHGSIVRDLTRRTSGIDIHVIADRGGERVTSPSPPRRRASRPLGTTRVLASWALLIFGTAGLTLLFIHGGDAELSTALLVYLTLLVTVSAIGGITVAAVGAVGVSLVVNFFLVDPVHTFTISAFDNVVALAVFVIVALTVGSLVHVSTRRGADALRSRAEAAALARAAADLAAHHDPLPSLLEHLRSAFALDQVRLVGAGGDVVAEHGTPPDDPPADATTAVETLPTGHRLELRGRRLSADDRRVVHAFGAQLTVAIEQADLERSAAAARELAAIDEVRVALLRAVSHDLRTPLASIKAMVSGLRDPSVAWTPPQVQEGLATIEAGTDQLTTLVNNLLDAGRLEQGTLAVDAVPVDLADAVAGALRSLGPTTAGGVVVAVDPATPPAWADPALVERVIANVVANAVRHSPAPESVVIGGGTVGQEVVVRVVDHGPGIPVAERERVLSPFQRLGDRFVPSDQGVGLGLSISVGFATAMGGSLELDDTPGGGLTVTLRLPAAVTT